MNITNNLKGFMTALTALLTIAVSWLIGYTASCKLEMLTKASHESCVDQDLIQHADNLNLVRQNSLLSRVNPRTPRQDALSD